MTANSRLIAQDLAVLWHPCTQMKDHEWLPMIPIRRGQGVWLEDFDGNRYLDAISSWWVNIFGHAHPYINNAIKQQLDTLEHVLLAGFTHEPIIQLSQRLVQLVPQGLTRCFYADNGSAAVEIALKMSFHYFQNLGQHKKTKFICLSNSYHGETLGALSVGNVALYKETYAPLLMQAITVESPDCFWREPGSSCREHSIAKFNAMHAALQQHAHEVCAVIVEPLVQCASGMRMYDPVYLKLLRNACDEFGVQLIVDEIATGFGRTGSLFACEQAHITPDYLCLGKGLTGGYLPLSVVLTQEHIYQAFYADYDQLKAFLHSHSYTGNPLACAAANATLDLFEQTPALAHNAHLSKLMHEAVEPLRNHPHVAEIRQRGMILALEMIKDKSTREPYPWQERRGLRVYEYGLQHQVLLRPLGNVIYFMPPYVISDDELNLMAKVAIDAINQATL
jgi:adenosylmethionine---8-amino-7-oxononanoate aminotransferase